jgi:hypothetical protein
MEEAYMAGRIKYMIDTLIDKRSHGNPALVKMMHIKLKLKGVPPDKYTWTSEDDPTVIEKLRRLAEELGVSI